MFGRLEKIFIKIKELSNSVDKYQKDTIIQSLPSLTYVNRAKKLIENNKFDEAEKILKEALALPQEDALVYKYLGIIYERTGKNELAVANYQISADLDPHDKNIWQRLGFVLISVGKFEQAEKSFENSNKVQSGNTDTFTGWGMSLVKQQKFDEARKKFAKAIQINKYNFSAVFLCAVMEIKLEMYDQAELKLSFLANVSPNEGNTFEFARLKALKNDYNNAIFYAKKSLEYNPNMLPAYILLGQVYGEISDEVNSLQNFEIAEEKGLVSASLYYEWGKALQKFEKFDKSIEKYCKAYEMEPENLEIVAGLGLSYVLNNDFEKAKPLLEKVMEKEPDNTRVKQALAVIDYEQGETDKAIATFKSDDENAFSCYYLAKCYEKRGEDTKVCDYYESALRINEKFAGAYKDYVNFLISKNNFEEARRKLRKALKNNENNIDLLNLMFYVNYILVKEKVCEYNLKETLAIAQKIENYGDNKFEYCSQKQELENLLKEIKN